MAPIEHGGARGIGKQRTPLIVEGPIFLSLNLVDEVVGSRWDKAQKG